MSEWTSDWTDAAYQADKGLAVVVSLLSWVKDGQGKPNVDERHLFMAAVAFTYGVWENYVEQVAIEATEFLSSEISPERVALAVHQDFTKNRSAWEVSVSPGWQALWVERVRTIAVGDGVDKFGINTANKGQVENLFKSVGLEPFRGLESDRVEQLQDLIGLRGEIVHTSTLPESLRKSHATTWRDYVQGLYHDVDESLRAQCDELLVD